MPRRSTPNKMNTSRPAGPSSPPQTPRSKSPSSALNHQQQPQGHPSLQYRQNQPANQDMPIPHRRFGVNAVSNGVNFGDRPDSMRANQLSPHSSSSSSAEESDSDSSTSDSPPRSLSSEQSGKSTRQAAQQAQAYERAQAYVQAQAQVRAAYATASNSKPKLPPQIIAEATFIVEELTDCDGSDEEDLCNVIRPDFIEYAESERSRSGSRNPPELLDRKIMSDLRDLRCYSSDEESEFLDQAEHERMLLQQREERRRKRMSSGSISKRTISERGSDSDREDLHGIPYQDPFELNTRRIRRRVGDNRRSLQFQDPPRIDELDEPDSSEEILDSELLARELPFYDYIFMEVDSP